MIEYICDNCGFRLQNVKNPKVGESEKFQPNWLQTVWIGYERPGTPAIHVCDESCARMLGDKININPQLASF
jgi:hypothetical protein